jgi:hypothetical protein
LFLLSYPAIQYHSTLTVFAGPVKESIPLVGQLLTGTVTCTWVVCPGDKVPLNWLRFTPFKPLLFADQFNLRVFELLVNETEHLQRPPVWSSVHCRLAKMSVGVPDKVGAGMTVSVTFTVKVADPILKVTPPVYVPAASWAFMFEAVTVMLLEAPAFKVLAVGLANNQFPPLLVRVLADQAPGVPQLVIVTVCAAGLLTLATPL